MPNMPWAAAGICLCGAFSAPGVPQVSAQTVSQLENPAKATCCKNSTMGPLRLPVQAQLNPRLLLGRSGACSEYNAQ